MFSSCSWSSDSFITGPLLFLLPDEDDDGGGLLEAAEDGRELFLEDERSFIDFMVVDLQCRYFWHSFVNVVSCLHCRAVELGFKYDELRNKLDKRTVTSLRVLQRVINYSYKPLATAADMPIMILFNPTVISKAFH